MKIMSSLMVIAMLQVVFAFNHGNDLVSSSSQLAMEASQLAVENNMTAEITDEKDGSLAKPKKKKNKKKKKLS